MNSKYSNFLTGFLIAIIAVIIIIVGVLIYKSIKDKYMYEKATEVAEKFEKEVKRDDKEENGIDENLLLSTSNEVGTSIAKTPAKKITYGGYTVVGTLEIPSINIKYPILEKVTRKSIQLAVAYLYGPGINKIGNTVVVGHNYNNGKYFSNLKDLQNGDILYVTDDSGVKLKYKVYNVYVTNPEDSSYMNRDTAGGMEISLSTCAEQGTQRTVVWAKAVTGEKSKTIVDSM